MLKTLQVAMDESSTDAATDDELNDPRQSRGLIG